MMSDTPTADEAPDLDGPRLPDRGRQRRQLISERDRQAIRAATAGRRIDQWAPLTSEERDLLRRTLGRQKTQLMSGYVAARDSIRRPAPEAGR